MTTAPTPSRVARSPHEPPDAERALRRKVEEALRAGRLPESPPVRTWAGPGTGGPCRICDEPLRPSEIEFELEYLPAVHEGDPPRVHGPCFRVWEHLAGAARAGGGE